MAKQFYETYRGDEKVASLLRQLPWTRHLMILGRSRYPEEREFYMRMAVQERWRSRELDRQIKAALFERVVLYPVKLSTVLREVHPRAAEFSRDSHLHFQTREKKGGHEIISRLCPTSQPKILTPKHLLAYCGDFDRQRLLRRSAPRNDRKRGHCEHSEAISPRASFFTLQNQCDVTLLLCQGDSEGLRAGSVIPAKAGIQGDKAGKLDACRSLS